MAADELADIGGAKPKLVIAVGDEVDAPSQTSNAVYKVKRIWDHYYCTCPAWRNQAGAPLNARSCKHLRAILGNKYEDARIKLKNPHGNQPKAAKSKNAASSKSAVSKASGKRKKVDDDDEAADDLPAKRTKTVGKSTSKGKGKRGGKSDNDVDEEDDEEDEDEKSIAKDKAPGLLLAVKWDLEKGSDPTGWWISEKLDGIRVYYDGQKIVSRLGNLFTPPEYFLEGLPKDVNLDGELFGGRGEFQSTVSVVKTLNSPHWKNITFQVFDVPSMGDEPFEDRIAYLNATFGPDGTHRQEHVVALEQTQATSREHVLEMLKKVESKGGEGLMLRKPGSLYERSRSSTLQKIKTFYDAEAKVMGYVSGKGRIKGSTGALKCVMASGKTFNVGTGFSDKQRQDPPKIGSIITYRFQELTPSGVPRFPSYIGEAIDKDEPKDAEIPEHRKGSAQRNLA